jgi:hypothetical protein
MADLFGVGTGKACRGMQGVAEDKPAAATAPRLSDASIEDCSCCLAVPSPNNKAWTLRLALFLMISLATACCCRNR